MKTDKLTQEAVDTFKEERTPEQQALVEKHCDEHERLQRDKLKCPVRVEPNDVTKYWGDWALVDADGNHLQGFTDEQLAHRIADVINGHPKMMKLLKVAKCPAECNNGRIANYDCDQAGDTVWHKCQFCSERKHFLASMTKGGK